MADDIFTTQELKDYLGVRGTGRDARMHLLRSMVDARVREYTARDWGSAERADELYEGSGTTVLALRHYPASDITKLEEDGTALDYTSDDVVQLRGEIGLLYRTDGGLRISRGKAFGIGGESLQVNKALYVISYTGGKIVPEDLKGAALELASWVHQATGSRKGMNAGGVTVALFDKAMDEVPTAAEAINHHTDWAKRAGGVRQWA